MTMDDRQKIEFDALLKRLASTRVTIRGTDNVRDLGGLPAADNLRVRHGVFFRGEALAHPGPGVARVALWDENELDAYRRLSLSLVIDLRAPGEVALAESAWADANDARMLAVPIAEGGEGDATDYVRQIRAGTLRSFSAADLAAFYAATVRARADQFGEAIRALAQPANLPVLIHCSAGKDRTGMLVALVLEAIGTPREYVVADYALTGVFRPNRVAAYADVLLAVGVEQSAVAALFEAPAAAMQGLLDGIDDEFGSVRNFLVSQAQVEPALINALADVLLEPAT
jgi:protein-tyrosine phosphatase